MRATTRDDALNLQECRAFLAARSEAVLPCTNGTHEWTSENDREQQRAAALCQACAVRVACGRWALAASEKNGVWGGMTAAQRKRQRRQQAAA
jgi:hypothetical protein